MNWKENEYEISRTIYASINEDNNDEDSNDIINIKNH